jgi:hypothetical protein
MRSRPYNTDRRLPAAATRAADGVPLAVVLAGERANRAGDHEPR